MAKNKINDKLFIEIWSWGTKMYIRNSNIHNEYGPAVIFSAGKKEYWIDDKKQCIS